LGIQQFLMVGGCFEAVALLGNSFPIFMLTFPYLFCNLSWRIALVEEELFYD